MLSLQQSATTIDNTQQALAQALAQCILQELQTDFAPTAQRKQKLVNKLHDTIPARKELTYIQIANKDAPKQLFADALTCLLPSITIDFLPQGLEKHSQTGPISLLQAASTYLKLTPDALTEKIQAHLQSKNSQITTVQPPATWGDAELLQAIEEIYQGPLIILKQKPIPPQRDDYCGDPIFVFYEEGIGYSSLTLKGGYNPIVILEEMFSAEKENTDPSDVSTQEQQVRLFCVGHGEFSLINCLDIEHASPHANIRANQKRLLGYLNASEHKNFADYFLAQPHICEYFQRDRDDVVKGTAYFYKMSYNAIVSFIQAGERTKTKKAFRRFNEDLAMAKDFLTQVIRLPQETSSGSSSSSEDDALVQNRMLFFRKISENGALVGKMISDLCRITRKVYGNDVAAKVLEVCKQSHTSLAITGDQWREIFHAYNNYIVDDAFRKRDKQDLLLQESDLFEKIQTLYASARDANEEIHQRDEQIVMLKAELEALSRSPTSSSIISTGPALYSSRNSATIRGQKRPHTPSDDTDPHKLPKKSVDDNSLDSDAQQDDTSICTSSPPSMGM